jgi:hypothetical protein
MPVVSKWWHHGQAGCRTLRLRVPGLLKLLDPVLEIRDQFGVAVDLGVGSVHGRPSPGCFP